MLFPEAKNESKKKQILTSPVFSKALQELEASRQHYLNTPIEPVPFNLFKLYYTEGDRRRYEDLYFARRGRLTTFTLSVLLHNRRADIEALEDTIWAICEEYTWVLPAHSADLGDCFDRNIVDLFSAETGFALAEIHYLLSDKLDEKINKRIKDCVEERIFEPYLHRRFHWETNEANWAAVCAGSVGGAFIYLAPNRFETVRSRIIDTLNCFLKGFGEDGVCVEGIGYWNYGFGFFTYFSQLLYEFTDGAENLFELPICRKVALFQQNAFLRKNFTISFSDGYQTWGVFPGLTQKLHDIYGEKAGMPSMEYAEFDDNCHRFPAYLRNFFWVNPEAAHNGNKDKEVFYPSAKWYLCNDSALSLAAKAGHNGEPHNHNDVGSFSLVADCGQILCDFGCGEYNRDYFDPKNRYTLLCNSSRGHSVPIINGKEQQVGEEYCGRVISHEGGFAADIAGAYGDERIKSLTRELSLRDNIFELCDRFEYNENGNAICERFVTMFKPEWDGKTLKINGYKLEFDSSLTPKMSSEKLLDHSAVETTLYMLDFELNDPEEFRIKVYIA